MFKKLVLVLLFGISALNAEDSHAKTGFMQKIKNSPAIVKVVAIIPCLIAFSSLHYLIKEYKDNPDKINIVGYLNYVKWTALAIGGFLFRWLLEFNLKNTCNSPNQKCLSETDIPKIAS